MTVLSERLILARARADSLPQVRNLNLWGNDLSDVNILERMPGVEILSLSVNRISSMKYFQNCPNLVELYLRKNDLRDLHELQYLISLPKLRVLWLSDNPLAKHPKYRPTVLRALPWLHKLDNITVTPDEVERAQVEGVHLDDLMGQADKVANAHDNDPHNTSAYAQDGYLKGMESNRCLTHPEEGEERRAPAEYKTRTPYALNEEASKSGTPGGYTPSVGVASSKRNYEEKFRNKWERPVASPLSNNAKAPSDMAANSPRGNWGGRNSGVNDNIRAAAMSTGNQTGLWETGVVEAEVPRGSVNSNNNNQYRLNENQNAKEDEPSPVGGGTNANVLYAVLTLLKELDEDGLRLVNHEVKKALGPYT
eukprot:Nk52_evm19s1869 gene=Nk52_evmTU19s1869